MRTATSRRTSRRSKRSTKSTKSRRTSKGGKGTKKCKKCRPHCRCKRRGVCLCKGKCVCLRRRTNKRKKQRGGSQYGNNLAKTSGYSIPAKVTLRGHDSALANPPPIQSYNNCTKSSYNHYTKQRL